MIPSRMSVAKLFGWASRHGFHDLGQIRDHGIRLRVAPVGLEERSAMRTRHGDMQVAALDPMTKETARCFGPAADAAQNIP